MSAPDTCRFGTRGGTLVMMCVALSLGACAHGTPGKGSECGDGTLFEGEECDDGNLISGDGCNGLCEVEDGFLCDGTGDTYCHAICGDGQVLGAETCDGSDVGGITCASLELGIGEVVCGADCQLDTSGCQPDLCGNGEIDEPEECDGADVGGETCQTRGYDDGSLACTSACLIDDSSCVLYSCGNGIVEGIEECDDLNTDPGDGCAANCSVEDGWQCVGQPSVCARLCGNSTLDTGEECDGAELNGQSCTTLGQGFDGGVLTCATNCTFDTSACEMPDCGNGALDVGEQCDGVLLGGQSCAAVGPYTGGSLTCNPSCTFNVSGCWLAVCGDGFVTSSINEQCDDGNTSAGDGCSANCNVELGWECDPQTEPSVCTELCGNLALDVGEQCDGGLLGGETCQSIGYDTGSLTCAADCTYDTSGCSMYSCGDGMVTGVEQCDDGNTASGDGCSPTCQVESGYVCDNTQQPSVCVFSCGNGAVDPGEDCEGGDLNGGTCQSLGFAAGTLACDNCSYDTSGCLTEYCSNGIREGSEECDGNDFGGQTCSNYGFTGGSLTCTGSCTIDTSTCSTCPATLTSVFSENFASPSSSSWTQGSGAVVNGSIWSACSITNHGVRIYSGRLEITNDMSGSPAHGQAYAYTAVSAQYDTSLYNSTLANNNGLEIVWSLNMRRNDPEYTDGGFSCTSTGSQNDRTVGLAYVLAGSSAADLNASTSTCSASAAAYGYAVVMGGSSGSVRLVRFQDGLRNGAITDIVSSGGFSPDRYFSVRVTYNTVTHQWQLEARSDGSSSFSDPASGSYGFAGTGTDSTYAGFALDYTGPYFQTGCCCLCSSTYTASFDNVSVGVRCAP